MMLLRTVRLALLCAALQQGTGSPAQTPPASTSVAILLARAARLNASGKSDLAVQAWQQVLLADPDNFAALAGLVRAYAQSGDQAGALLTLHRLRAAHPSDPELPNLERDLASGPLTIRKHPDFPPTQDARLLRAEESSRQGDSAEAFRIYRLVFGEHPPLEWALFYYQAEAAISAHRADALAALQSIAQQHPDDASLNIALGQMLTLDAATRVQGTQILARYASSDPAADRALRQSLLWGVDSPAMATEISAYLARQSDPQLATAFARAQSARRQQTQSSDAYRALQRNDIPVAEEEFRHALQRHPNDRDAMAGLGFVSLQQRNFFAAVHWLALAQQHGDRSGGVHRALQTARFWQSMAAAQSAIAAHNPLEAESQLHRALDLEPENPNAMLALAGLLAQTKRPATALPLFRRLAQRSVVPGTTASGQTYSAEITVDAWSGWLASSAALQDSSAALAAFQQLPPNMQTQLSASPTFLASLAQVYLAANQRSRAEEVLYRATQSAAALSPHRRIQILLQYAALCVQDRNYSSARAAYADIVKNSAENPANDASAWQGLVLIEHLQGRDANGLQVWNRMPPALRQRSMQDNAFLLLVAAMEQSRKNFPAAISLYHDVLARDPNHIAAWTELLRTLHSSGNDRQARDTEQTVPPTVRSQLRDNPVYFQTCTQTYYQTMAAVEQALGNPQEALDWLQRMSAIARSHNTQIPVDMQLQEAWLQYDLHQDDAAQASLRRLQQRLSVSHPATVRQQNQIAELTANLAVRQAVRLANVGNRSQAIQVLDTASNHAGKQTAPRLRLAAGYLAAGAPVTAVAIYQSAGLQQATLGDRKAAIGAAMESKQPGLAQAWLQQGLADHPHDAGLLLLAAQFAESNGNQPLATRYLQAALASSSISPAQPAPFGEHAENSQPAVANSCQQQLVETDKIHQQAAQLLATIQATHSGWLGGTGYISHIVGTPGTTQLTDVEIPLEASVPIGHSARLTAVVRTARLNSGSFHGNPNQSLGTLPPGASAASAPTTGVGGSLQIATRNLAAAIGTTPAGFPVVNLTAAASLHMPRNPWTLAFTRDSMRESQLSYAGLQDPAQPTHIWGGAIVNLATVQFARGNAESGWYASASGGLVTAQHVVSNPQITGDAGAYRQIWSRGPSPNQKSLKLGINLYAQHNDHNELFFTYGHGGYFSPQYYLLPAVPLTYTAQLNNRLHYELSGSLGPQVLSQSSAAGFPLDPTLQVSRGNPVYPAQFSVGVNYGAQGKISYLRGEHWLLTAFLSANNAASYNQQIGGFSLRYLFREQPVSKDHASGWFPYSGLRPYQVP